MNENVLYTYLPIDESNFEHFLNVYFDENGNCTIDGVEETKEEMNSEIEKLTRDPLGYKTLRVSMKISLADLSEDEIKAIVMNGKLHLTDSNNTIFLDYKHYGLKHEVELTNPFKTEEDRAAARLADNTRREKIVSNLLECKNNLGNKVR